MLNLLYKKFEKKIFFSKNFFSLKILFWWKFFLVINFISKNFYLKNFFSKNFYLNNFFWWKFFLVQIFFWWTFFLSNFFWWKFFFLQKYFCEEFLTIFSRISYVFRICEINLFCEIFYSKFCLRIFLFCNISAKIVNFFAIFFFSDEREYQIWKCFFSGKQISLMVLLDFFTHY